MANVNAAIAGIMSKILVKPGDTIKEGQEVAIIESMKMQIPITSEVSGTVSNIKLAEGDFVNEGDVIMILE